MSQALEAKEAALVAAEEQRKSDEAEAAEAALRARESDLSAREARLRAEEEARVIPLMIKLTLTLI